MTQQTAFLLTTVAVLVTFGLLINSHFGEQNYENRMSKIVKAINSMDTTWQAHDYQEWNGMTFGDLRAMNGYKRTQRPEEIPLFTYSNVELEQLDLPQNFSSIEKWPHCKTIGEIRDQSSCGSCWAFASSTTMSDRYCIGTGINTRISSEDLVSCCFICGMGCEGGNSYPSWLWFRHHGLVTGYIFNDTTTCRPYTITPCAHFPGEGRPVCPKNHSKTPKCVKKCIPQYPKTYEEDLKYATDIYSVSGAKHMQAELYKNGPIQANFQVYEDFKTYKSGVYQHKTGGFLGGHSVRIVGYGVENGIPYWRVANSWGVTWGDKGFFKFLRGANECQIEYEALVGTGTLKKDTN